MKLIHDILLWVHILAGVISLILFWIPVLVKKGGDIHRKIGRVYYWAMWIVQITAPLLCMVAVVFGHYTNAAFLGFLAILTAYPLWYSYEILQQYKTWSDNYFHTRRVFAWILFFSSIGMLIGAVLLKFKNEGVLMIFFGLLGLPAIKDALMTKENAMNKENKLTTHINGTIISGIAAYTAFLSFGGRTLFAEILPSYFQIIPWIAPTIIGIVTMRIMKNKYSKKANPN